jgi:prepilin-type N-terminal cleavage/methylation domain-containing protein
MRASIAPARQRLPASGFTLLELLLVIAIIAVLASLVVPALGYFKRRAQDAQCMANLRTLHAALSAYMTDHAQVWPQDPDLGKAPNGSPQAKWWYETLKPYGPTRRTWLCPSHSTEWANELDEQNYDFSYIPTNFNPDPNAAYQYQQPWVIEFGGYHDGNQANQVMPDGSIRKQENPAPPSR